MMTSRSYDSMIIRSWIEANAFEVLSILQAGLDSSLPGAKNSLPGVVEKSISRYLV